MGIALYGWEHISASTEKGFKQVDTHEKHTYHNQRKRSYDVPLAFCLCPPCHGHSNTSTRPHFGIPLFLPQQIDTLLEPHLGRPVAILQINRVTEFFPTSW